MQTISTRLIAAFFEVLDASNCATTGLLDGLALEETDIREGVQRVTWDSALTILARGSERLGGLEPMREAGRMLLETDTFQHTGLILSHLADTWQIYRVMRLWLAPSLVFSMPRHYQEREDGTISLAFAPPFSEINGAPYLYLMSGVMEMLPTLIGAPPAQINVEPQDGFFQFHITPAAQTKGSRAGDADAADVRVAYAAIHELIYHQSNSQTAFAALQNTIDWLDTRSERLETFSRLGHTLAEKRDLDTLVQNVLSVLVLDFDFHGGALEVITASKEERRWGMGIREGESTLSYPFGSGSDFRATLELWGEPRYEIGGSEDPVARLMPWLSLALGNAIAFQRLEDERRRSDERLQQLKIARGEVQTRKRDYRMLVEDANDAIAVFAVLDGRLLEANRALSNILGYTLEELRTMTIFDILAPEDLKDQPPVYEAVAEGKTAQRTHLALTRTGAVVALEAVIKLLDEERVQFVARDITQWRRVEERLRESEERYALAVQGANDGLWDWDMRTGHIYYSPRWKQMLGYEDHEVSNAPDEWFDRIHIDDRPAVRKELREHLEGLSKHFFSEYRMRHKSGAWIWVLARGLAVRGPEGEAYRMAGSQSEITQRKAAEAKLIHSAFHDSLTGLPNRAWVTRWLVDALQKPAHENPFALLYFDLDRFKVINDSLGHIVGDEILRTIATRLRQSLDQIAEVARIGGDEFIVLMPLSGRSQEEHRVAERIIEVVNTPIHLKNRDLILGCSIGIALRMGQQYDYPEDMIRDADLAMYAAKSAGGNRFQHFTGDLHTSAFEKMQLEVSLRKAIENDELALAYQPIICGQSGQITAVEALARWPRPGQEPIPPSVFIPLAEETGLIHPLGRWVLQNAAIQVMQWRKLAPDLQVNINLSPRQLQYRHLNKAILAAVNRLQVPPEMIAFEVTENALMHDSEDVIRQLNDLREAGLRIYIDDFGTGYSSLSYLVRLPFDAIKIDRSFITNIEHDDAKRKVVLAMLDLSLSLGSEVVIEGLETTDAQDIILRFSNKVLLQGNGLSPAVSAERIEQLLQEQTSFV